MSDDENKNSLLKQILKAVLIIVVIFVAVVVIGFGLLVGFCALGSRR